MLRLGRLRQPEAGQLPSRQASAEFCLERSWAGRPGMRPLRLFVVRPQEWQPGISARTWLSSVPLGSDN
jgi:hypothetical protein